MSMSTNAPKRGLSRPAVLALGLEGVTMVGVVLAVAQDLMPRAFLTTAAVPLLAVPILAGLMLIVLAPPNDKPAVAIVEATLGAGPAIAGGLGFFFLAYGHIHLLDPAAAAGTTWGVSLFSWALFVLAFCGRISKGLQPAAVAFLGVLLIPFCLGIGYGSVRAVNAFYDSTPPRKCSGQLAEMQQTSGNKSTTYAFIFKGGPDCFSGRISVTREVYDQWQAPEPAEISIGAGRLGYAWLVGFQHTKRK
jgi:hypothetical protein